MSPHFEQIDVGTMEDFLFVSGHVVGVAGFSAADGHHFSLSGQFGIAELVVFDMALPETVTTFISTHYERVRTTVVK
jgi:hypothetical protein